MNKSDMIAGYLIQVPEEQLRTITRLLEQNGVRLDPRTQAISARRDGGGRSTYGQDAQHLLAALNEELEKNGRGPIGPARTQTWTPRRFLQFLEFTAGELEWEESGITWTSWDSGEEFDLTAAGYPLLLGGQSRGKQR